MRSQLGFTIMEILIVLALIALIMGVLVVPRLMGSADDAQRQTTRTMLQGLALAYERWALEHPAPCPAHVSELQRYQKRSKVQDPWGHDFILLCGDAAPPEAEGFGAISVGRDGVRGTADDITSWE